MAFHRSSEAGLIDKYRSLSSEVDNDEGDSYLHPSNCNALDVLVVLLNSTRTRRMP